MVFSLGVVIVEGSEVSIDILAELYYLFYGELRSKQGLSPRSIDDYRREIKEFFEKGDKFFVVMVDGFPAGFVRISEREGAHWIEEIFVRAEFRGRGLGRMLVEAAENYVKSKDNAVYIMVLPQDLDAINFWVRMGYKMLNTIELVKFLDGLPKPEDTRILEVLGFPLMIWKWSKESYGPLEAEFLETLREFFRYYRRSDFLRVVMDALKKALKNNRNRYLNGSDSNQI